MASGPKKVAPGSLQNITTRGHFYCYFGSRSIVAYRKAGVCVCVCVGGGEGVGGCVCVCVSSLQDASSQSSCQNQFAGFLEAKWKCFIITPFLCTAQFFCLVNKPVVVPKILLSVYMVVTHIVNSILIQSA